MNLNTSSYNQKIEYARMSLWAPFYAVGMVARIQGDVPPELLEEALHKLRILYPPLASRVQMEPNGDAFLTTADVGDFDLEVRLKKSDEDWESIVLEQDQIPFPIERGPLTRFLLLRNPHSSDLIVIAPHVICDGYAMTHVMYDLVSLLNDPQIFVSQPNHFPAVTWNTVQHTVFNNLLLRGFVKIYNQVQAKHNLKMNQEAYEALYESYWARHHNNFFSLSLSPSETNVFINRCKEQKIAVTGALFAAWFFTQTDLRLISEGSDYTISTAVNIRKWMHQLPDKSLGVFASSVDIRVPIKTKPSFWRLAQIAHKKIHKKIKNHSHILRTLVLDELNPLIADKIIAALATEQYNQLPLLLKNYLKLELDSRVLIISNIGQINLPNPGNAYPLDTILPLTPIGPGYRHSICALTVNDQMHLAFRFHQLLLDQGTITQIKERMRYYLLYH